MFSFDKNRGAVRGTGIGVSVPEVIHSCYKCAVMDSYYLKSAHISILYDSDCGEWNDLGCWWGDADWFWMFETANS